MSAAHKAIRFRIDEAEMVVYYCECGYKTAPCERVLDAVVAIGEHLEQSGASEASAAIKGDE